MKPFDIISGVEMRREHLDRADDEYQARRNRQRQVAQTCAEEIGEVLIRADLDDEDSLRSAVEQINAIAANARIFVLEALDNKRLRKALKGP